MCDSCSCRDQPLIADLGVEHTHVLELADRARRALRAGRPEVARALTAEIVASLGVHTRKEEAGLFTELAVAGYAPDIEILLGDHHVMDAIAAAAADPALAGLDACLSALEQHIYREEQDVFPAAMVLLDGQAWARAEAAQRAVASEAELARVLGIGAVSAGTQAPQGAH